MEPQDKRLYAKVKKEADAKFLAPTSVYKSAWIVREYKKRGGTYNSSKPDPNKGLTRWFKEKWVDLNRRSNEPCGRKKATADGTYPLCRPTVKVTDQTPRLKQTLSKKEIEAANKKKQKIKHRGRLDRIGI